MGHRWCWWTKGSLTTTGNWQFDPLRPLSVYVNCTADDSHNSAAQSRCRSQLGERFESEPKPRPRPRPRPRPKSPRLCPVSCQVSLGINKCKTSTPWAQNCYRHRGGYLVRPSVDFDIDIDSDSDTRRNAVRCDVARLDSPFEIGIAIGAGIGIHSVVTPAKTKL